MIVNPGGTNERFDRANLHQAEIVGFPDQNVTACSGRDLGDPRTHEPGAHDSDPRDRAHADTTSISPIMNPRVCMGPLLPSRYPPPQGTKHCQRYVPVALGDMKLNVSAA